MRKIFGGLFGTILLLAPGDSLSELYISPVSAMAEGMAVYTAERTPRVDNRNFGDGVPLSVAATLLVSNIEDIRFESPPLSRMPVHWEFVRPMKGDPALVELARQNGLGYASDGMVRGFARTIERAREITFERQDGHIRIEPGTSLRDALELIRERKGEGWKIVWLADGKAGSVTREEWIWDPFLDETGKGPAYDLIELYGEADGLFVNIHPSNKYLVVHSRQRADTKTDG